MIKIDGYPIDVELSSDHTHDAEVSKYPIEKGGVITDHVVRQPLEIDVEGVVSDTPIGAIKSDPSRTGDTAPTGDAYNLLRDLWHDAKIVSVETSLDFFEQMVVTHLSIPRSKGDAKWLHFNATFQQLTILENSRTTVRVALPIAEGKDNLGTKEGKKSAYSKEQQAHDKNSIESVLPPGNHVHYDPKKDQWQLDAGAPITKSLDGGIYQYDDDGKPRNDVPWYVAGGLDANGNRTGELVTGDNFDKPPSIGEMHGISPDDPRVKPIGH